MDEQQSMTALSEEEQKAIAERLAAKMWNQLAGVGWRGYMKQGRGAVVMAWSAIERWRRGAPHQFQAWYATHLGPELDECLEDYDPDTQIVLAFLDDDDIARIVDRPERDTMAVRYGPVAAWPFSGPCTPADAHARRAS